MDCTRLLINLRLIHKSKKRDSSHDTPTTPSKEAELETLGSCERQSGPPKNSFEYLGSLRNGR